MVEKNFIEMEKNKMSKEADHMSTEEQVARYLTERAIQRDDG